MGIDLPHPLRVVGNNCARCEDLIDEILVIGIFLSTNIGHRDIAFDVRATV